MDYTNQSISSHNDESIKSTIHAVGDFSPLDGSGLTPPAVPPMSDTADEWTALLEGDGLTPPPIPPTLLPLDSVGDESGIFDIRGLTPPPIPPRSRSLSPAADPTGLWEESGLTPPTMSLGLEIIPTQSDGSKLETDPIVTAGMGSVGPSKSPKIDLGTVELTDTESHSSSSMDISSEDEPRPRIPTPPVLGLTTEQMEGTNNIYSS